MPSFAELDDDRNEPNLQGHSLAAYAVLNQAMVAIRRLKRDLNDPNEAWYVSYVSAVALLRSIGHVLKNQDCEANSEIKSFVDAAWPAWKNEIIFADFIERPRNALLKHGELPIERNMGISWSGPSKKPGRCARCKN